MPWIDPLRSHAARDGARELGAIQQRVGIGPLLRLVAKPLGRLRRPDGMPELSKHGHRRVADLVRVERAKHSHQPVLRRAELARAVAPRLGQIDERGRHRAKIAVGVAKHPGDAIDRRRGRLIAHEMGDELRRQEPRGRRVTHERANHALSLFDARFVISRAEHGFRSGLVQHFLKRESDAAVRVRRRRHGPVPTLADGPASALRHHHLLRTTRDTADRPSRENLRELLHVLLRVAAVDAQRVQLEQLARVVFVQASSLLTTLASSPAELRAARLRSDRLEVVEVDEHRRMLRRCEQHVFEAAEHVRPDRFALVTAGERRDENLRAHGNTEMIRPERDEALDERTVGRHALGERGTAFGGRNGDERATRLLAGLPPRQVVGLSNRAERANGIGNCVRRAFGRRAQDRRAALQLPAEPAARIADPLALAGACAEPKPIEGAKRGIHESTSIH